MFEHTYTVGAHSMKFQPLPSSVLLVVREHFEVMKSELLTKWQHLGCLTELLECVIILMFMHDLMCIIRWTIGILG